MTARTPKLGRPPEFKHRCRVTVLLERDELAKLHRLAQRDGVSASAYLRRLLQGRLRRKGE